MKRRISLPSPAVGAKRPGFAVIRASQSANGASALILRWKVQLACAVVWWVAAAATCFGTDRQSMIVFLIAIFLCQIAFGIYGVIAEAQVRERRDPIHA